MPSKVTKEYKKKNAKINFESKIKALIAINQGNWKIDWVMQASDAVEFSVADDDVDEWPGELIVIIKITMMMMRLMKTRLEIGRRSITSIVLWSECSRTKEFVACRTESKCIVASASIAVSRSADRKCPNFRWIDHCSFDLVADWLDD